MPPFLPRKRLNSPPPRSYAQSPTKRPRLADALDADFANSIPGLKQQHTFDLGSNSSSESSLSDIDSDQFEDVIRAQARGKCTARCPGDPVGDSDRDEEDEDIEWEDAGAAASTDDPAQHTQSHQSRSLPTEPLKLNIRTDGEDGIIEYGNTISGAKKGPTRREKEARIRAHQLHVQFLLFHNALRNSWLQDEEVQRTLIDQLPPQILKEVERWKRASGLVKPEPRSKTVASQRSRKGKRRSGEDDRSQRDWGNPSQRLEEGKPDMSQGDPLIVLLKVLAAYWKKRFVITAPGLRKRGYGTKLQLRQEISSFRNEKHNPAKHGERIQNLKDFRKLAGKCEGSRDVGGQLFTALLRGLGIEARMVASLQPTGYGWTKAEQMVAKRSANDLPTQLSDESTSDEAAELTPGRASRPKTKAPNKSQGNLKKSNKNNAVIDLDSDSDDESIIDVTPSLPKQQKPKFDRDLAFPVYWSEAISPITHQVLPVSSLLENPVASTPDILYTFEPRGAKAERVRQVIAYVVAYSSDGMAKDVTVRYLKKHIWPGKTKGFRYPVEKVPLYDKQGRIKRYEDYDWFKYILSPYGRSYDTRTLTDDIEEASDLIPQEPEKKKGEDGADTLQGIKQSADFCLERFLRREEALKPGAEPVRMFVSGKGDKLKEEPVYRRADVERCLTAESWHKEGRQPRLGETPMKLVPVRAVTLTRKREAEEHERITGEKQMQGLYSWDQTEWIIPAPIKDGVIPKNAYGNMDCFVPSMVPKGAVHIPLKGTIRVCKKLEIDFAEAVTGFEFGNKRAVPVCTGVVVAKENEKAVKEAWRIWNEEQKRKEETKMEKLVLDMWRKFVLGLRIRERITATYGGGEGVGRSDELLGLTREDPITLDDDQDDNSMVTESNEAGGFVPGSADDDIGGGFFLPDEEPEVVGDLEIDGDYVAADDRASQGQSKPMARSTAPSLKASTLEIPGEKKQLVNDKEESPSTENDVSDAQDSEAPMDFPGNLERVRKTSKGIRSRGTRGAAQKGGILAVSADTGGESPDNPVREDSEYNDNLDHVSRPTRLGRKNKPRTSKSTTKVKSSSAKSKEALASLQKHKRGVSVKQPPSPSPSVSPPSTSTPAPTSTRSARTRTKESQQSSTKKTRSATTASKASVGKHSNVRTRTSKRGAAARDLSLSRESTLVTSPYFDEDPDGVHTFRSVADSDGENLPEDVALASGNV